MCLVARLLFSNHVFKLHLNISKSASRPMYHINFVIYFTWLIELLNILVFDSSAWCLHARFSSTKLLDNMSQQTWNRVQFFGSKKQQLLIHDEISYQRIALIWKEFESPFNFWYELSYTSYQSAIPKNLSMRLSLLKKLYVLNIWPNK